MTLEQERWALVFAHPGHELRCHHVIERTRPSVSVLTDGSGATGTPRIGESTELLASLGATTGCLFGALSDRDAYTALMRGDASLFVAHATMLADMLVTLRATAVAIDAAEGYNPVHDVCHWVGRAAMTLARRQLGDVAAYELDLVNHPDGQGEGMRVTLDDAAFARKLEAAKRYAPLAAEAAGAITEHGLDAFRVEFLRRLEPSEVPSATMVPYYEQVGEARVRAGRYTSVLRYGAHVRPVIRALAEL
jgi:hypothetical protein